MRSVVTRMACCVSAVSTDPLEVDPSTRTPHRAPLSHRSRGSIAVCGPGRSGDGVHGTCSSTTIDSDHALMPLARSCCGGADPRRAHPGEQIGLPVVEARLLIAVSASESCSPDQRVDVHGPAGTWRSIAQFGQLRPMVHIVPSSREMSYRRDRLRPPRRSPDHAERGHPRGSRRGRADPRQRHLVRPWTLDPSHRPARDRQRTVLPAPGTGAVRGAAGGLETDDGRVAPGLLRRRRRSRTDCAASISIRQRPTRPPSARSRDG